MSPKNPTDQFETTRPSKLTSGIFPSSTSFSIEVAQESAKLSKSWRSDSRGSQVLFILKKRKTELYDVTGKIIDNQIMQQNTTGTLGFKGWKPDER